jgi:hypothetical protein
MVHIVFNEADVTVMQQAMELDETLQGNVVLIRDDYAVGPIEGIYTEEGLANRKEWWRQVLAGGDGDGKVDNDEVNDQRTVAQLRQQLKENEDMECWIWMGQNKHDVSGYYWLLPYVQDFVGRVQVLYLNNLPFINEKGNIFYPNWLSQILPKEFLKAKKLARPITLSEFEIDPDEWKRLCEENGGVRLLEGGKKLASKDIDFYDGVLAKYITKDWTKANKVISHFLSKEKETTGDWFLLWRLKTMIAEGGYDVQGKLEAMRDFEVKQQA